MTKKQQQAQARQLVLADRILDAFAKGYGDKVYKVEFAAREWMGDNLWITVRRPDARWFETDAVLGTLGPKGGVSLKVMQCGSDKKIETRSLLEVNLSYGF